MLKILLKPEKGCHKKENHKANITDEHGCKNP